MSVWILCHPRTGSSYLCQLLNHLDLFPTYSHPAAENRGPSPIRHNTAFGEWLRLFRTPAEFYASPPAFTKCHSQQYLKLFGTADLTPIRQLWPQMKFIHLRRRNRARRVASVYLAQQTNCYHIYGEQQLQAYRDMPVVLSHRDLITVCRHTFREDHLWLNIKACPVYYEELVSRPTLELQRILRFLSIDCGMARIQRAVNRQALLPMGRPETTQIEQALHVPPEYLV